MDVMDRDQTMEFLRQHVKTEMLMKHLLSVEASMCVSIAQGIRVVAAGPGQLGPVARFAAEGQGIFPVLSGLVQVTHGLGQKTKEAVNSEEALGYQSAPSRFQGSVLFLSNRPVLS